MLNSKLKRSALSLILALVLVFSLFSVSVFAEDAADSDTETEVVADGAVESGAESEGETEADDGHDHDHDHDHGDEKEEEKKGMTTFDIVSLVILGVLIVVGVIYCLKNKEKVGKFLRSLKSEFKKISWSSWKDVRKNTLVVLVVVIAVAILIGIVDVLFSKGIIALDNLIG